MVRIKRSLADVTLEALGSDLGAALLQRGAVHPIYGEDRKKPGYSGHNEPWFDHDVTDFLALGFNAGQQSGLTVWDCDRRDIELAAPPNLLTRRGFHVYSPYQGEKHLQSGVPGLDVLTNGNVAFWSDTGEKQLLTTVLADPHELHHRWLELSGRVIQLQDECIGTRSSLRGNLGMSTYTPMSLELPWSGYLCQVEARGLRLNMPSIETAAALRMGRAGKGTRNAVLYQQSLILIQCGSDPWILEDVALSTGLDAGEIADVITKATVNFDPSRLPSVLEQADAWREAAGQRVERRWHPMLDELVIRAVEQNTIAPMVNQSEFPSQASQSTISRQLSELALRGLVHKRPMGRRGPLMRCNCYRLCMRLTARFSHQPCDCSRKRASLTTNELTGERTRHDKRNA